MNRSTIARAAAALVAAMMPSAALFAQVPPTTAPATGRADPSVAAQMSLHDAKDLIQRWKRWLYDDAESAAHGVLEFTPEQILGFNYDTPPQRARYCSYDSFDPIVPPEARGVARIGTHYGTAIFMVASNLDDDEHGCVALVVPAPNRDIASQIAAAMLRWKNSTLAERQALLAGDQEAFAPIVATYRASNPSPQIPEDVHRSFVMAQAAIQDKRFSDAVDDFEDGLKLAPWWPEGHFNIAIILGELHYYDEAIDHMKKYIALLPDATNARAAQDKIYVWEGEQSAAQ